jgi:hypothetical protein
MKKNNTIQMVPIGFYHPLNTNWSYEIILVIDNTGLKFYKSVFGADTRKRRELKEKGFDVEKLSTDFQFSPVFKWSDVKNRCKDIEEYNGQNYEKE